MATLAGRTDRMPILMVRYFTSSKANVDRSHVLLTSQEMS